ncbi:hypothetical protein SteCoe_12149 [Stentor coeruleus]|uniref:Uncharacterized protein n=1 Tax=Stentor coeruleus TaxID=5963 RepID=A0A1R2CBI1_9CILI|nr:hypothetical protein SteCoe_12149 [Stentor coeruleus]
MMLRRAIRTFIPKNLIEFNSDGKKLIFTFDDDNAYREGFLISFGSASAFLAYSVAFNAYMSMPMVGCVLGYYLSYSLMKNIRLSVKSLFMLQDGKNIEMITYNMIRNEVLKFPIDDIKCLKSTDTFKITYKKKTYLLDQEGRIHDLDLFYAVMRNMVVDSSKISVEKKLNIN